MTQTFEAVLEDGKSRLLEASEVPLSQGQRVRITVEVNPEDILDLAGEVYAGLSEEEIEAIEQISLDRRAMFPL